MSDLIAPRFYGGLPADASTDAGMLLLYFDPNESALGLTLTHRGISRATCVRFRREEREFVLAVPASSEADVVTLEPNEVELLEELLQEDGPGVTICVANPTGGEDCYKVDIFRCNPCPMLKVRRPGAR